MFKLFLSSIGKAAGTLLGTGLLILIIIILKEIEVITSGEALVNGTALYNSNFHIFWIACYLLLGAGFFLPLTNIKYKKGSLQAQAWVGFIFILLFIVLMLVASSKADKEITSSISTLLVGVVVLLSTGLGWVINHQHEQVKHRVSHTYKVLLDSRLSSAFQERYSDMVAVYPTGKKLLEADVIAYVHNNSLDDDKFKAVLGASYILDFYEFIASGIESEDLDEEFLYQNARGFVCGMFRKSAILIESARNKNQPKAWIQLEGLVNKWDAKYASDPKNRAQSNNST